MTGCRMKEVADPPDKENVKMWMTHISHSVADPHVKGSTVIHYVADPQVNHMRSVAPTAARVNSDG